MVVRVPKSLTDGLSAVHENRPFAVKNASAASGTTVLRGNTHKVKVYNNSQFSWTVGQVLINLLSKLKDILSKKLSKRKSFMDCWTGKRPQRRRWCRSVHEGDFFMDRKLCYSEPGAGGPYVRSLATRGRSSHLSGMRLLTLSPPSDIRLVRLWNRSLSASK